MNLLHDPWIPVVTSGGYEQASLLDVFDRARDIYAIVASTSLETTALERFLIAIYIDSMRDVRDYLRVREEDFSMVGERRFAQSVRAYELFGELGFSEISLLTNNAGVMTPSPVVYPTVPGQRRELSLAQTAISLITRHAYSLGGIQRGVKNSILPGVSTGKRAFTSSVLSTLVEGECFFDTLEANYYDPLTPGVLEFVLADDTVPAEQVPIVTPATSLFHLSRMIWTRVNSDNAVDGVIIGQGRTIEADNPELSPHVLYRPEKPVKKPEIGYALTPSTRPVLMQFLEQATCDDPVGVVHRKYSPTHSIRCVGQISNTTRIDGGIDVRISAPQCSHDDMRTLCDLVKMVHNLPKTIEYAAHKIVGEQIGFAARALVDWEHFLTIINSSLQTKIDTEECEKQVMDRIVTPAITSSTSSLNSMNAVKITQFVHTLVNKQLDLANKEKNNV